MSELKKYTRLGGNSRQLAALLQAKAPKGHMLAYINPQEAALLKAHGGSGRIHEDTGIPSYELDDSFALQGDTGGFSELTGAPAATTETYGGDTYASAPVGLGGGFTTFPTSATTSGAPAQDLQLASFPTPQAPSPYSARDIALGEAALTTPEKIGEEPGLTARAAKALGIKEESLGRLGLAGALGLLGSRTARAAQTAGQAGKAEMQQLATPYQTAGAEMRGKAERGELMPVAQQSLQAAQAQIAQDIQRRGGVGAQQAANQMANLRQQLLQQQYDYGLKLSGIGDNIALGAIKTGLQADQYVNQLTNSFYTNMAYIASGMTPGIRLGGQ